MMVNVMRVYAKINETGEISFKASVIRSRRYESVWGVICCLKYKWPVNFSFISWKSKRGQDFPKWLMAFGKLKKCNFNILSVAKVIMI